MISENTKRRLGKLLEVLEKVQPKMFNLSEWKQDFECGTVACACGHAALDPWFERHHFRFKNDALTFSPTSDDQYSNWNAVTRFFEIPYNVALGLFLSSSYALNDYSNKQVVIEKIQDYLNDPKVFYTEVMLPYRWSSAEYNVQDLFIFGTDEFLTKCTQGDLLERSISNSVHLVNSGIILSELINANNNGYRLTPIASPVHPMENIDD